MIAINLLSQREFFCVKYHCSTRFSSTHTLSSTYSSQFSIQTSHCKLPILYMPFAANFNKLAVCIFLYLKYAVPQHSCRVTVEKNHIFMLKLLRIPQPFQILCVYISESSFQGGQNEQNGC